MLFRHGKSKTNVDITFLEQSTIGSFGTNILWSLLQILSQT